MGETRLVGLATGAAVLGLVLGGTATASWAEAGNPQRPPTWWEGSSLTGDWGGQRPRLAEHGISPYAIYTVEGFGTVTGGSQSGGDWTSQLEFGVDVDTQKLVGLAGGSAHASFLWIEGTDPSERVGSLNTISNLSAPAAARVYQLWYKQALGPVTLKVGQVVASDDFMVSPRAALYLNAGFGTYPTFTANINAPTYPLGAPGAFAAWQVTEAVSIQSGVYVADAGPNDGGNDGFGWRTDHGWVVFVEAAYTANPAGQSGVYKVGGYYDTGRFDDLATGGRGQGNGSLYVLADQTLFAGGDRAPTVAVFAGFGLSPQQDRNTVYYYGQGGINAIGLLPSRPKDTLGLAVSYTRLSDDFVRANRVAGTPVSHQEVIVELTYQVPITPFLILQPDVQAVFDATQSRQDAVIFGLRLQATF
jgi:porin